MSLTRIVRSFVHPWLQLSRKQSSIFGTVSPLSSTTTTAPNDFVSESDDIPQYVNGKRSLPLNIYIDNDVRLHCNMRNSDRKARIYLPADYLLKNTPTTTSIKEMREIIEKKFSSLINQPYVLRYQLPGVMPSKRQFSSDEAVYLALHQTHNDSLPCIQLFVDPLPGIFPPPTEPYLFNMADPEETETFTVLSFYRFFHLSDPSDMAKKLEFLWKPFRAVGRIYVAREGINAQMVVPTNVLSNFQEACNTLALLEELYLNCDHKLTRKDYEANKPFKALHIRVRDQIVADGFAEPLDWSKSGAELSTKEWHDRLDDPAAVVLDCRNSYESDVGVFQNAIPLGTTFFRESWDALEQQLKDVPKNSPIMTYCTGGIRCVKINAYLEQKMGFSNVGRLQGGIISYARDLEKGVCEDPLAERREVSSDRASGAGEVESDMAVATSTDTVGSATRNIAASKFKGVNYVFDERMGARITADILSHCETCGVKDDSFTNCAYCDCHVRFIQCPSCAQAYSGCCSMYCQEQHRAENSGSPAPAPLGKTSGMHSQQLLAPRIKSAKNAPLGASGSQGSVADGSIRAAVKASRVIDATFEPADAGAFGGASIQTAAIDAQQQREHAIVGSADAHLDALSTYCERYSEPEPVYLQTLQQETKAAFGAHSRMISGHLQGRLLCMLTALSKAKTVLELGAFTGYSALCFAEGLVSSPEDGSGFEGKVVSCEIDPEALAIARSAIASAPVEIGRLVDLREVKGSELIASAREEGLTFDLVFIDADKKQYETYLLDVLGVDATRNESNHGHTASHRCLLSDGALILVDNTLWKGLVLSYGDEDDASGQGELGRFAPSASLYGNEKRMLALAECMHKFNKMVKGQGSLRPVILPLRDGLSAIRYVKSRSTA